MISPLKILKEYWGHDNFRAPQDQIIDAVVSQNDVIALLPTGGGKSICFQIPALMQKGVCIVISPLIALMQDQVDSLNNKGIKAMTIPSGMHQDDIVTLFDNLKFGNYKFLYLSPERLQSPFIQEKIKQLNVNLFAIDEAHCISEWGHDFRPSYKKIKLLKEIKPSVPFIALTATATKEVLHDISTSLTLNTPITFKKSFYRNNLAYQIFTVEDKLYRLIQICKKTAAPIIVYVSSRNKTKEIATFLNAQNFKASYYHGGMSAQEKKEAFKNWLSEKTPIIIATNAFGMGIDKDNVKVVIHLDLPNSIENYIQEAGRAGRNGKKAFSAVLQNKNDVRIFKEKAAATFPSIPEIKNIYKRLFSHYQIALGEIFEDGFEFHLLEFCNKYQLPINKTQTAINILANQGIVQVAQDYSKKSTLHFLASSKRVINYCKPNTKTSEFIQLLLRSYGGLFEQPTNINEYWLSQKAQISIQRVIQILEQLQNEELVAYQKATTNATLCFLHPREDNKTINAVSKNIKSYIKQKVIKSEQLIQFIENDNTCRSIQVLNYFNEKNVKDCGICDVCISKKHKPEDLSNTILQILTKQKLADSKQICQLVAKEEATILVNLQQLLVEDKISINNYNQYYIK